MDNRGKRSIAIALDRPDGAEIVRRLIDRADVFLCNLLPHRQERYGLDPATVHARNRRARPRHAVGLRARRARRRPARLRRHDVLRPRRDHRRDDRARRGRPDAAPGAGRPHDRHRHGRRHPRRPAGRREARARGRSSTSACSPPRRGRWPPTSRRRSSTGHRSASATATTSSRRSATASAAATTAGSSSTCRRSAGGRPFCKTVERAELLEDERFLTVKDRFDNMPALIDILDEVMATKTLVEWGRIFDDAGLIWGPASSIDELANDPQAAAIGMFPTIEHPEGDFRTVAAPMRITGADIRPRGPAPAARRRHRRRAGRDRLHGRRGRGARRGRGRRALTAYQMSRRSDQMLGLPCPGMPITAREQTEVAAANASDQQPVVFVHGLWMLAGSWDAWRELFSERGYSTIAVDWPDDPPSRAEALSRPEVSRRQDRRPGRRSRCRRHPCAAEAQADRDRPLLRGPDGADRRRPRAWPPARSPSTRRRSVASCRCRSRR